MPPGRVGTAVRVGVFASAALGLAACGFGDLVRSAGPLDVSIAFTGDSTLTVGAPSAFSITVTANGVAVSDPALTRPSTDTTVFTINATRASLVAVSSGNARFVIQLNDAAFTDSMPTRSIRIRSHGGP